MTVVEKHFRYMQPGKSTHKTLEEAMRSAWVGCETNTHYTDCIVDIDGTVYDREAIQKYWAEKGWIFTIDKAIDELVDWTDSLEKEASTR